MANMNLAGPPKPGMPPMPQQYQQQYAGLNNNQIPPQSMAPGTAPTQSYQVNNNNQFPTTNSMQNGIAPAAMLPMPMANKVPMGQFSPSSNPPAMAPPPSQTPTGFPSQPIQAPSPQLMQQQMPQQGQRPPIPGEPAANLHQNGHKNGPEIPSAMTKLQQTLGMPPAPLNNQASPQQQHQQTPNQGRPPMINQYQGQHQPVSSPSQMPPTGQQFPGQPQQPPTQQFSGQPLAQQYPGQTQQPSTQQYPGMPPLPGQQMNAAPQYPGMMPQQRFPQQPPIAGQPMQQPMPGQFLSQPGMTPQSGMPPQPGMQPQQMASATMQNRQNFPQQPGMYPQPGQYPQQPGMAPQSFPASPMQAAPQRRLDPDQMPNPIQVMAENQRTAGGPFSTLQVGQVPPLVTTDFITQDQGNSGPRYVRSTMYNVPANTDMMKQSAVPFALVISPFARNVEGEMAPPIVDFGDLGPIRCIRCKAYMSPHMQFIDAGRKFQCLLCKATTEGD